MSMLAEKKRKQKWSLNPRGKAWSQDSNKFGQKLLEKMGWSQGKGLGAKEDGRTEHIKVSYKNDSQGMGYKESDNQWTEHESNFSALLSALSGGGLEETDIKLSSLEKKSENSKVRVHYRKFTRGKDLSRYSEKDLANIFGKRSLKENKKTKKDVIEQVSNKQIEQDKNFSNAGLMSEYFKKKLPNFSTSGYVIGNNGVMKKVDDSESESEQRPSFGFGFGHNGTEEGYTTQLNGISGKLEEFQAEVAVRMDDSEEITLPEDKVCEMNSKRSNEKPSFVSYINENEGDQTLSKKKKDRKRRNLEHDMYVTSNEDTPTKKKKLEAQQVPGEGSAQKKKDKTKKKVKEDKGLSNPAFDPLYTPIKIEKHILDPIEESIDESHNGTLNDTVGEVAEDFEVQVQIVNEDSAMKRKKGDSENNVSKKKKKKKGKTDGTDNINVEGILNINQSIYEAGEIRKKKSRINEEHIFEVDKSVLSSSDITKKERKKKKLQAKSPENITRNENQIANSNKNKSNSKKLEEGVDNPFFNISMENDISTVEISDNPYEVKIEEKSKKKISKNKENLGLENPVFSREDSINAHDLMNEEYEVKRKDKNKKKKKKDKEENKGLDNPVLNLNDTIDENCDLMLNVVATPVQSIENQNVSEDSVSIQKVREVARRKSVRFSDVTRERIIPNKEEIAKETLDESRDIVEVQGKLNDSSDMTYIDKFIQKKKAKKRSKGGLDNGAFDQQANNIEENITTISKTLDAFQAEIENDINEAKIKSVEIDDIMVGEVGNPDGTNEKLPDGSVKLKFKYASFKKTAKYVESLTGAKKSYKHLIKGDIVMHFKETNLHEIDGYAVAKAS